MEIDFEFVFHSQIGVKLEYFHAVLFCAFAALTLCLHLVEFVNHHRYIFKSHCSVLVAYARESCAYRMCCLNAMTGVRAILVDAALGAYIKTRNYDQKITVLFEIFVRR